MVVKKILMAAALVAVSGTALAETIPHTVMVEANVPTSAFYVNPMGGNWINLPVQLTWNNAAQTLMPATKQFDMKSTLGPIQAHLVNPAKLVSGADNLDLEITVAGKTLSTTPTEVLSSSDASAGRLGEFKIAATKPAAGFKPGAYSGNVELMFESVLTP